MAKINHFIQFRVFVTKILKNIDSERYIIHRDTEKTKQPGSVINERQ